jgi:hypothetical protein
VTLHFAAQRVNWQRQAIERGAGLADPIVGVVVQRREAAIGIHDAARHSGFRPAGGAAHEQHDGNDEASGDRFHRQGSLVTYASF